MRDQYAGDLSDLLKFSFLRALASDDKTIGVGWYYNPKRGRIQDGRHREYCSEPTWASLDRTVWNALRDLPERSVSALEGLSIWPADTKFHHVPIPSARDRTAWARQMTAALEGSSIVFLDPDNGIGNATEQHATMAEVAALRQPGRTIVLIKFPSRGDTHERQIERYHRSLLTHASAVLATTLRTCVSVMVLNKSGKIQAIPRVRWFTLVDADAPLIERTKEFANKIRGIEKCTADVAHGTSSITSPEMPRAAAPQLLGVLTQSAKIANVCPECGHRFRGHGFDGIDAHWRARHEGILPYTQAWPLIKSGNYRRDKA